MDYQKSVKLEDIITNPLNDYDVDQFADLEWTLRLVGLVSPLTVVEDEDGKYKLIDGERRYLAMQKINEDDGEKVFDEVPCLVKDRAAGIVQPENGEPGDPEGEDANTLVLEIQHLMLEIANQEVRNQDKATLNEHRLQIVTILHKLIEFGVIPEGNLLDKVKQSLSISPRYSRMFLNIFEKGSDEVKKLLTEGEMAVHEAASISNMDADAQAEVTRKIREGEKPKDAIRDIKEASRKVEGIPNKNALSDEEQMLLDSGNIEGSFDFESDGEDDFGAFKSIIDDELSGEMDFSPESGSYGSEPESEPESEYGAKYDAQVKAAIKVIVGMREKGDFSDLEVSLWEEMRSTLSYMDSILL